MYIRPNFPLIVENNMNSHFRKQFLKYCLAQKLDNGGFTLIELLVVIIIVGILSAIALPSFIQQSSKAKQVEAKLFVGSMNRAQQVYYLQNTTFTNAVDNLGIGIKSQTDNYEYNISMSSSTIATNNGISKKGSLKSYVGVTFLKTLISDTTDHVAISILCESPAIGEGTQQTMALNQCPSNWIPLQK